MDGLTVGRIVHYVEGDRCLAAIVAHVHNQDGVVNLGLFAQNGSWIGRASVYHDEQKISGSWHWPERAPAVERRSPSEPEAV